MGLIETASAINGGNSTIKIVIGETPFISHGPSCSFGVFDHFLMWVLFFSFHFSLYVMLTALFSLVNKNPLLLTCNFLFVSSYVDGDCHFWILRKLLGSLNYFLLNCHCGNHEDATSN
ncbi:unnamed protein product [Citrullus colocynthis]|uniref:Transmembrane protein n=1 Tax=Citrullus colocynthis TaxID=252529 RepID=A0ABP0XRG5_9ROSI